jgi:hypothetical protein
MRVEGTFSFFVCPEARTGGKAFPGPVCFSGQRRSALLASQHACDLLPANAGDYTHRISSLPYFPSLNLPRYNEGKRGEVGGGGEQG